jgi:hypothetical protein
MTKRDFIYVALLIALATGPIIDAFTGVLTRWDLRSTMPVS